MEFQFWHMLSFGLLVLVTAVTAQVCPPVSNNTLGTCNEACSSDGDCSNGQLCCSNGCGHVCMSPDPCATVRCAAPSCNEHAAGAITPEGECCPVCACAATDGSLVPAGTSFMNDCNTCSCGSTGVAACTLMACVSDTPPTTATPTTETAPPTDTVPTGTTPPTCPVGGQVRVECASACNITCANVNEPVACLQYCVINGCQCPSGTVIDEQTNTCVPPSDCPSTVRTCPTVQSSNEENCVDECSSDDDCQYDRICCSNGCGGHTCSDSVEMCELIQCDWPVCEGGVQPVTSPFSCCPYCPTTDCPVKGQVRVDCATSCVITCANMNSLQYCPESCQLNGCECPQGSVINERINACVRPADCNSTTVRTCPTVQSSNEENCVDECSSDDDCQYDRICCSNGCGGHTCSDSVEMCQLVRCAWPVCEDGAQPVTSPFSCCPYCPTTGGLTDDNGGTGVIAIASLMTVTMCGLLTVFF